MPDITPEAPSAPVMEPIIPKKVEKPTYEPVTFTLKNIQGHDVRATFLQNTSHQVNLLEYDVSGQPLRPEHGLGEFARNAPEEVRLKELQKIGSVGPHKDLSPLGRKDYTPRDVLSSEPYEVTTDKNGNITVKYLQYQRFDDNSKNPYLLNARFGKEHQGWSGKEIKALVAAHWISGIGPVIEPTIIGGRSFQDELAYAETNLTNEDLKKKIASKFEGLDEKIKELQLKELFKLKPHEVTTPPSISTLENPNPTPSVKTPVRV